MHLVAVNHQLTDRNLGVGTVYGNAKRVAASSRSITAAEILFNMMNIVFQQFYMGAGPHYADAQWSEPVLGGTVVPNFNAFDSHVTPVVNGEYAASAIGSNMLCIQHRCLSGIASESNEAISRVAGCLNAHQFLVDSTPHIDRTTRARCVSGMLNGAPRCRLGAGIRIIPGRRYVEGGTRLARGPADAHQQHKKDWKFHSHHSQKNPRPQPSGPGHGASSLSNSTRRIA